MTVMFGEIAVDLTVNRLNEYQKDGLMFIKRLLKGYWSFRKQLAKTIAPGYPVILDFPIDPRPRYGYGKSAHPQLEEIIGQNNEVYVSILESFICHSKALSMIARNLSPSEIEPTFQNNWFSGLDAIALYSILASNNPRTIFEIGSGYSTKFARRAIHDHGLKTQIISCDPKPRVEIDKLSDKIIRQPFETIDLSVLDSLESGDILFIDSSHRSFTNSDVTVEFLEALPRLKAGVLVHIHDILLPFDYPPGWSKRHYSEQYLLACYLLGGSANMEIILPNAFISKNKYLAAIIDSMWQHPAMADVNLFAKRICHTYLGFSFWMRTKS